MSTLTDTYAPRGRAPPLFLARPLCHDPHVSPAPTQAPPHTPRRRTGFSLPAFGASLVALLALAPLADAATPAFPGAHGFGAVTPGGRGGDVIHVTTLAPKGPGSLQEALDRDTPRVVVFDVSGIIEGDIEVTHGRVTIAGQTAPGAGITIRGRLMGAYDTRVTDIVIRHLRVRPPPLLTVTEKGNLHDAVQFSRNSRVMLDHVSASWASDETCDFYEAKDLTLQDSTVEESSLTGHPEGAHAYGIIVGPEASRVSIVRTLVAHHMRRAPAFATGPVEFRNNVVYDVRDGFLHDNPAEGTFFVVGNVWKRGRSARLRPFVLEDEDPSSGDPLYVVRRNRVDDPGAFVGTVDDPFAQRSLHPSFAELPTGVATAPDGPVPGMVHAAPMRSPEEAYAEVLRRSGAFPRDTVTRRTIEETRTRCGHWGAKVPPDLLEGLTTSAPPLDTDRDGMPDAWETARGLSPTDPSDTKRPLEGEYTAIEVYVNELADRLAAEAPAPLPDQEGPCPDVAPSFADLDPGARKAAPVGCSCDTATSTSTAPEGGLAFAAIGVSLGLVAARRALQKRSSSLAPDDS